MPSRDWALVELVPAWQSKSMSLIKKPSWHVVRTLYPRHLGNQYTALPSRPTGYVESSHFPLSHRTFLLCLFFGAVVLSLYHHVPIGTVSYQVIRKYFATSTKLPKYMRLLKIKQTKFISTIIFTPLLYYSGLVDQKRQNSNSN